MRCPENGGERRGGRARLRWEEGRNGENVMGGGKEGRECDGRTALRGICKEWGWEWGKTVKDRRSWRRLIENLARER